jgi:putative ABC transport system permease protein
MNRKAIARLAENIRMGLDTVRTHRVRSALVILGVMIGVATLMGVVTIVRGFTIKIEADIKRSDTAVFRIVPYTHMERSRASELRRRPEMTEEDRRALIELAEVRRVAYIVQRRGPPFIFQYRGEKTRPSSMIGSSEDFSEVVGFRIRQGRSFTEAEVRRGADVIVLGSGPAETLFPHGSPLGKKVRVLDAGEFLVVGTFQPRKTLFGSFAENYAVIPYTTMQRLFPNPRRRFTALIVQPARGFTLEDGMEAARTLMRQRRRVPIGAPDNFDMFTEDQVLEFTEQVTGPMAIVLVVLSSIALLVGGIGLMAIQLVSVTERTREIGVRKALGARRKDILSQFLIEAATLTGLGGILGVAGGLGLGALASAVSGFPAAYSPLYVAIAVAFSCGIGIFFGLAPAIKASRLDPIEALRHE